MTRDPPNRNSEHLTPLLRAVGTMVRAQSAKEAKAAAKAVVDQWCALEALVR